MAHIKVEYRDDVDLESLEVGDTVECTKGTWRELGYIGTFIYEISKSEVGTDDGGSYHDIEEGE